MSPTPVPSLFLCAPFSPMLLCYCLFDKASVSLTFELCLTCSFESIVRYVVSLYFHVILIVTNLPLFLLSILQSLSLFLSVWVPSVVAMAIVVSVHVAAVAGAIVAVVVIDFYFVIVISKVSVTHTQKLLLLLLVLSYVGIVTLTAS